MIKYSFDMSIGKAMEIAETPDKYSREKVDVALMILAETLKRAMERFDKIQEQLPKEGNYP